MIQRSQQPCFALEACQPLRISRESRREHLDGDLAPELRIARPINLAHAASTESERTS